MPVNYICGYLFAYGDELITDKFTWLDTNKWQALK